MQLFLAAEYCDYHEAVSGKVPLSYRWRHQHAWLPRFTSADVCVGLFQWLLKLLPYEFGGCLGRLEQLGQYLTLCWGNHGTTGGVWRRLREVLGGFKSDGTAPSHVSVWP